MTDKNYTHVSILVDRSGSMYSCKEAAEKGLKEYVDALCKGDDEVTITVSRFDDQYEAVCRMQHVADSSAHRRGIKIEPRGSTALWDSVSRLIGETGADLEALEESRRPARVLFVIVTDGMENSSQHTTAQMLAMQIAHQRDVYSWQFVYLAANQDAILSAAKMAIPTHAAMNFVDTQAGTSEGYGKLMRATVKYRESGTVGQSMNFFEDEVQPGVNS